MKLITALILAMQVAPALARPLAGDVVGRTVRDAIEFRVSGDLAKSLFEQLSRTRNPIVDRNSEHGDAIVEGPDFSCVRTFLVTEQRFRYQCSFYIDADGKVQFVPGHMIGGGN